MPLLNAVTCPHRAIVGGAGRNVNRGGLFLEAADTSSNEVVSVPHGIDRFPMSGCRCWRADVPVSGHAVADVSLHRRRYRSRRSDRGLDRVRHKRLEFLLAPGFFQLLRSG